MSSEITIRKLSAAGEEIIAYTGEVLEREADSIKVRAVFDHEGSRYGTLEIERGDVFIEGYFENRWYNIFEVRDGTSDRLKGWYCNIARPAVIEDQEVLQEDLALDFVVDPEGVSYVFDREEFEVLPLSAEDREQAQHALKELQELLEERKGPFQWLIKGRP